MASNLHNQTAQKPKNALIANIVLALVMAILIATAGYFGYQLRTISNEQKQIKEDYSMVNNITFGVFSIDLWSESISKIISQKIKGFKITSEQKLMMREQVEKQLHSMVNQVVKEFNKPQKNIGGKLKNFAFKKFVDPKELHQQVPSFAKTIIDRITSPRATNKLKTIATGKVDELVAQTYDSTKVAIDAVTKTMFDKYQVTNKDDFNKNIDNKLFSMRKASYNDAYYMLGCMILMVCLWVVIRKWAHLHTTLFVMSLLFALVLLFVGVTVSIIDVDARLSSINIMLMGENIAFKNQVLFYQSKSILDIADVLIKQPKPDAITVGVLILLFVIILPVLRITARGIHRLAKPSIAESGVVKYLAFESGKWDMADVMVVGIAMTYIGLNGILKSQLTSLNIKNEFMTTATVNNSSLQPGYIIFVGYVIFAFVLSYILKKITNHSHNHESADVT
ncbi:MULTISPECIES: paraquat-inducible protein A [Pedobacter]|uniref:paraquat-inducible protein A n=1 Tax=Pedobacter TaxID=84567 RepID=UPI001E62F497|nr:MULTISPECIES: paraquat-inducible protein A [Pedobacter]